MKVKCTADGTAWFKMGKFFKKWPWSKKQPIRNEGPKYGDICTVVSEYFNDGVKFYSLIEWPGKGGYEARWFKPIDEEQAQFKKVTYSEIKKEVPVSAN